MGCAAAKKDSAANSEISHSSEKPLPSMSTDVPVLQYIAKCDLALRTQPEYHLLWLPVGPATTVREGTVVPGQALQAKGGVFIRVVVTTDESESVFCFLPLHGYEDPSTVLMTEYQIGEAVGDAEAMLLADAANDPGIYPGFCRYTTLQDITLRKEADFHAVLPVCDATTVKTGVDVMGQVLRGVDDNQYIKLVVVSPWKQGSAKIFCYLPLHSDGDPSQLRLSRLEITPLPTGNVTFADQTSVDTVPHLPKFGKQAEDTAAGGGASCFTGIHEGGEEADEAAADGGLTSSPVGPADERRATHKVHDEAQDMVMAGVEAGMDLQTQIDALGKHSENPAFAQLATNAPRSVFDCQFGEVPDFLASTGTLVQQTLVMSATGLIMSQDVLVDGK